MQYHALSLLQNGFHVHFVGYGGSLPLNELDLSSKCTFYYLNSPEKIPQGCSTLEYIYRAAVRVISQMLDLFSILLFQVPSVPFILVQNPPAIPSLLVLYIVKLLKGSKLVIDWHNFGYSIMALRLGTGHSLVKIAKIYEKVFARLGDTHLCVTKAMKTYLIDEFCIKADITVLYDRPPDFFRKSLVIETHSLLSKYAFGVDLAKKPPKILSSTCLTVQSSSIAAPRFKDNRPALLVSSTSWTEDEDFGVLLDALVEYESCALLNEALPFLVVVITGKGPLKGFYMSKIAKLNLKRVAIHTAWLQIEDYPVLLGSADLGISLHSSSSGLDLPMKIVDMFGCGLPVCALNYNCIAELVQDGLNGRLFNDSHELAHELQQLLVGFPFENDELTRLSKGVKAFQKTKWSGNWNANAKPLFS